MASFNRVILAGNLTRDPQLSYTPSNTPVCKFGLAINHRYKDRDGNTKEEVCFVDVSAFGRQAEVINQYMTKGRSILVEGRLRYGKWVDKDGQNRSKLDVTLENFTFLGSGQGGGGGDPDRPADNARGGSASRGPAGEQQASSRNMDDDFPVPEPDVPF